MKNLYFIFMVCVLECKQSIAQYPGGLSVSDMRVWVKADAGIGGTATNVTSWANQIVTAGLPISSLNKSGTGAITQSVDAARFNYQTVLNFPNGANCGFTNGSALTSSQLFGAGSPGSFYGAGILSDQLLIFCQSGAGPAIPDRYCTGFRTGIYGYSSQSLSETGTFNNNSANIYGLSLNQATPFRLGVENGTANSSSAAFNIQQAVDGGNNPIAYQFGIGTFPGFGYSGPISEVMVMDRDLTAMEMNKIDSYLAIKYGVTLSHDYVSTGTAPLTTYSLSNITAGYTNHIIGIGRDDNTELYQKQSHTTDDTFRIYSGTIALSNQVNASTFSADKSFVLAGDNNGLLCATTASNIEVPLSCGINSRIDRKWKVSNTSYAQSFNIDITLAACAMLNNVNANDLRLLVDDDGNFANGGTSCYSNGDGTGITISYSKPVVTISGINNVQIASNSTKFITIASASPATSLPVELLSFTGECSNDGAKLNWETAIESNFDRFEIQYSSNGDNFTTVGKEKSKGSNSHYEFISVPVNNDVSYYRLKIIDVDGGFKYSRIISVRNNCSGNKSIITLLPNPATNTLKVSSLNNGANDIQVFQVDGKLIYNSETSGNQKTIDISSWAKGLYILRVTNGGRILFQRKFFKK